MAGDLAEMRRQAYPAFRKRLGPDGVHLPDAFGDVVAAVIEFVGPLAGGPRSLGPGRPEVVVSARRLGAALAPAR